MPISISGWARSYSNRLTSGGSFAVRAALYRRGPMANDPPFATLITSSLIWESPESQALRGLVLGQIGVVVPIVTGWLLNLLLPGGISSPLQ